jgi:hypothetical protein
MITIPGGAYIPAVPMTAFSAPNLIDGATMDASGEKWAIIFRVPRSGTLDLMEFQIGTVGNNPDNGLKVSFQDLDANGVPDGTPDQYRLLAGPFTSNTWITPGLMTADGTNGGTKRAVTAGQMLAFVCEFESFTAGDSYNPKFLDIDATFGGILGDNTRARFQSAAWTKLPGNGCCALKYATDGYVPIADDIFPILTLTTAQFGMDSANDEFALRFQLPASVQCDGAWLWGEIDADADVVIYDSNGTTVLGSASIDASARPGTGPSKHHARWPAVTLQANTTYRVSLKATTIIEQTLLYNWTANSAGLMAAAHGGVEWYRSKRADGGSWTDENTIRPFMGIHIIGLDS